MSFGMAANPVQCSGGKPAEDVEEHKLSRYLCDVASDSKGTYPRACKICESQCAYGKRYLAIAKARKEKQHGSTQ